MGGPDATEPEERGASIVDDLARWALLEMANALAALAEVCAGTALFLTFAVLHDKGQL